VLLKQVGKMNDSLVNLLVGIKTAQINKNLSINVKLSNLSLNVLQVLKEEGYIRDYIKKDTCIEVLLKYKEFNPVIKNIYLVSTSGKKIYYTYKDLHKVNNGLGILILSTSKGIMSSKKAFLLKIGGEVLFKVL
jgi:small subunit ribosomal protein S8